MVCGSCGTTIADKAIVCYRCGQPTEMPIVRRPAAAAAPVSGRPWVVIAVLVLASAGSHWYARGWVEGAAIAWVVDAATALFLLAALVLAVRPPRRHP
jgi:hypothetical protein